MDALEVTLLNAVSGEEVDTTLTALDGSYWFNELPPGEYAVKYELPPDFVFSLAPSNDLLGKAASLFLFCFIHSSSIQLTLFLCSTLFQHHILFTHTK